MPLDWYPILSSVLLFGAVALGVWTVFRHPVQTEPPINRRIATALGIQRQQTAFEVPALKPILAVFLATAGRFPFLRDSVRQNLAGSGNPNAYSVEEYLALCLASAAGVTLLGALAIGPAGPVAILFMLPAPLVGFFIPYWSLREAARKRASAISKQLPYTLDLIAIMMEAGATFSEAINTLIRDDPEDDLNQELRLVQAEIEFGTQRATALKNMADRIPLGSLRSVVGAVNQAESLGTPLSTIMKNQSTMLRNIRTVRAEEASAKASLKILVPSLLILAAVVLVVFSPLILYYWNRGGAF